MFISTRVTIFRADRTFFISNKPLNNVPVPCEHPTHPQIKYHERIESEVMYYFYKQFISINNYNSYMLLYALNTQVYE